jgi:hypothetical protein
MSQQDTGSWIPPDLKPLVFEDFAGLNTKPSRNGIKDEEMFWCDGWMPLGKKNLRTLPDVGASIYTSASGIKIVWFAWGNIGNTPYCIVARSDGSVVAVNGLTFAVTPLLPAATLSNFILTNISQLGITQWGNKYIILVAGETNGFWIWDGTNVFQNGTLGPDVTLFSSGNGYTSQPTITTIGGSGTGATFTTNNFGGGITGVTPTNPGSGYLSTDAVILAFTGGGSSGVTANVKLGVAGGVITSSTIVAGGAGYSTPVGTILDSSGVGATISLTAVAGAIATVSIVKGGNGYSSNPQLLIQDPNSPVAVATVDLMPSGIQGTSAETFTSRLFISNGILMQISAPGSLVNFSAGAGGDIFPSTDSFLRNSFVGLKQSNGFIYLIADSSVNYISGIQTSGSPLSTTFTNQNADPENGSAWEPTIGTFGENIIFANNIGVQLGYGGRFIKISEALDGFYYTGNNGGGLATFTPSSAKAIIFGKKVWMLLYNINTPISGAVNKLLMTDGKVWWTSSQGVNLIFVAGQEINSILTAYGTDGLSIYPLFQTPSTNFTKTVQSKFWEEPGGYLLNKVVDRIWGAAQWNITAGATGLKVAVDTETNAVSPFVQFTPSNLFGISVMPPVNTSNWGVMIGTTVTTTDADVQLLNITIGASINAYRG